MIRDLMARMYATVMAVVTLCSVLSSCNGDISEKALTTASL